MNRPFPAFATLLLILTLAVIAVSANSRSISENSARPPLKSGTNRKAIGGPNFILVLPAPPSEAAERDQWHWVTSREAGVRLDGLRGSTVPQSTRLIGASLSVAEPVARTSPTAAMDYRSYHDPAYDSIVYGPLGPAATVRSTASSVPALSGDEMLSIFDEFGAGRSQITARKSFKSREALTLWQQARSASAAARLWLIYQVRRLAAELPVVSQPPQDGDGGWRDYAELMDFAAEEGE